MLLACTDCGSVDVVLLEIGEDDDVPSIYECEDCGARFEDPDHESARLLTVRRFEARHPMTEITIPPLGAGFRYKHTP